MPVCIIHIPSIPPLVSSRYLCAKCFIYFLFHFSGVGSCFEANRSRRALLYPMRILLYFVAMLSQVQVNKKNKPCSARASCPRASNPLRSGTFQIFFFFHRMQTETVINPIHHGAADPPDRVVSTRPSTTVKQTHTRGGDHLRS